uniref:Uncharacterized protein n=1 Tax=mine drainage metagenome TaxID=410659 RepID=E6PC62_9ZZZZ
MVLLLPRGGVVAVGVTPIGVPFTLTDIPVGTERNESAAGVGDGRVSGTGVGPGVGVAVPTGTTPIPAVQSPGVGTVVGVGIGVGVGASVGIGAGEPPLPPQATSNAHAVNREAIAGSRRTLDRLIASLFALLRCGSLRDYCAGGRFGSLSTSAIAR